MVKHECPNCKKIFVRKVDLEYHILKKKKPCMQNIISEDSKINKNDQNTQNAHFYDLNEQNKYINNIKINYLNTESDNKSIFECDLCFKTFSKKSNLSRHKLSYCKKNKLNNLNELNVINKINEKLKNKNEQIDLLIEQNNEIKKQNEKLQKLLIEENLEHKKHTAELHNMILNLIKKETKKKTNKSNINTQNNNIINNTTTNSNNNINNGTVNNNITIQFGKEDLSQIDNKHFLNLIKSNSTGVKIITDLVKMIHFNEEYPQFQNVYMTDLNRGRIILFDGSKWKTITNGEKIIPEIIEKAVEFSNDKENKFRSEYKLNKKAISRLDVIKKYTTKCDNEYLEELKEEYFNEEADNKKEIADCEQFIILVGDKVKELIYNEKDLVVKRKNQPK